MNKFIVLVLALAITHTYGAPTCPNPLATSLTVANENAAQTAFASANKVCASLNTAGDSCCTLTTVNGFETRAATLVTTLETAATAQDKAILLARKTLAGLKTKLETLKTAYTAAETKLTAQVTANTANAAAVKTFLSTLNTDVTNFFTTYTTLKTNFDTYQTKRATCLTALVKAQVAGWCLACNQNAEDSLGVASAGGVVSVTYAPDFLTKLRDACYPYFEASAEQTGIIRLNARAAPVDTFITNLAKIVADDNTGIAAINTAIPTTIPTTASAIPTSCTAAACTWIETALFKDAKLDNDLAIRGGAAPAALRRMLQSPNARMLAGTFGSATTLDNEAKITITVKANPGSVTNPNDLSALRVGVFSCIVAFFVALLI